MNKNFLRGVLVVLIMAGLFVAGCKTRGKTLATVGGQKITESDLDSLARINPRLEAQLKSPMGRKQILENYVNQLMMYLESKNRGLDSKKDVQEKIDLYKKIIVAQAVLDDELEKQMKEYYDGHRDEFERMKVSQILIRTVAEETPELATKAPAKKPAGPKTKRSDADALKLAQAVKERLSKGEDFSAVAKSASEDERTKSTGGSLGDITLHDKRLERWGWLPIAEKAFAMKTGEISDPIKTKDGYHIIKVDADKQLHSFEESKGIIRFHVQEGVQSKLLADLTKKYSPKYTEEPAAETQPASPPAGAAAPTGPSAPAGKP